MKPTILVCGHGPGISDAVARKFGAAGFSVALVARNAERLAAAADALSKSGLTAKAFPCDLGDLDAVRALVSRVRSELGPIAVVHWNAYASGAGDLATAPIAELRKVLDVGVHGLIAAVQESLPDLKGQKGAVLVTGGGFGLYNSAVDGMAVQFGAMGLAVSKAAQHKLVGLLNRRLAPEGVYVGEVVVLGTVKGTAFDVGGHGTIDPNAVAEKFHELYRNRSDVSVNIG